jgi:outer membrane protein OmpA-like peptidoglycan-associated protein
VKDEHATDDRILYRSSVYFGYNSYEISIDAFDELDKIAEIANRKPDVDIIVKGYTDSKGNYLYNQHLSNLRADAVTKYLVSRGVRGSRISAGGMGPQDQEVDDMNQKQKTGKNNRRVDIRLKILR